MKSNSKVNFIYQFLYQLIILGVPLVLTPYLTRVLGSEALGDYSYIFSIVSIFLMVSMLGIQNYGCRLIASSSTQDEKRTNFYSLFFSHLLISVLIFFIYLIFLFANLKDRCFYIIFIFYLLSGFFDVTWYYYGEEKFKSVIFKNILLKVTELFLIFLFVKSEEDIYIYALIISVCTLLTQFILIPNIIKKHKFYFPSIKEMIVHFKPLVLLGVSVVAVNIYCVFDKTLLGLLVENNRENVAFYDFSERLVKLPNNIFSALGIVLLPSISLLFHNNEHDKIVGKLEKAVVLISFLAYGAAFGLAGISNVVTPLYYGESFIDCAKYILMLCPLIVIIPIGSIVRNSYLLPSKRDKEYVFSLIAAAIVNLLLNIIMIPILNVEGAIVGTLCAELIACILQFYFVRKDLPIKKMLLQNVPFFCFGTFMFIIIKLIDNIYFSSLFAKLVIEVVIGGGIYLIFSIIYIFLFKKKIFYEVLYFIKKEKKNENSSNSPNEVK